MKKRIGILLTALFAASSVAAFEPPQFQAIREHLDTDGCRIMFYNPAKLKDMVRTIFDSFNQNIEKIAKTKSAKSAESGFVKLVIQGIKQAGQASGVSRIGCMGESAKETTGSTAENPLFISRSVVMLGASDKPDFIAAFSDGAKIETAELGKLPGNTVSAMYFSFHPEIMMNAVRRVNAATVLVLKAEQDFQTANGFPLIELLKSMDGVYSVCEVSDGKRAGAVVTVPDTNGKLAALLEKKESFKGMFRVEKGFVKLSPDFAAYEAIAEKSILADNEFFKRVCAGGAPESGNIVMYSAPNMFAVLARILDGGDNGSEVTESFSGLCVGSLTAKHFEIVEIGPFCTAGVVFAAPRLFSDLAGIAAAYGMDVAESDDDAVESETVVEADYEEDEIESGAAASATVEVDAEAEED